ncbi:MAG: hypothetical protein CMJ47_08370 [Planctomyces sp.]|nr:hypothetical protein [Planctomyces sp.]
MGLTDPISLIVPTAPVEVYKIDDWESGLKVKICPKSRFATPIPAAADGLHQQRQLGEAIFHRERNRSCLPREEHAHPTRLFD